MHHYYIPWVHGIYLLTVSHIIYSKHNQWVYYEWLHIGRWKGPGMCLKLHKEGTCLPKTLLCLIFSKLALKEPNFCETVEDWLNHVLFKCFQINWAFFLNKHKTLNYHQKVKELIKKWMLLFTNDNQKRETSFRKYLSVFGGS